MYRNLITGIALAVGLLVSLACFSSAGSAATPNITPQVTNTPESSPVLVTTSEPPPSLTYALRVSVPESVPHYDRDEWDHWIDEDSDCQNARMEVLIVESRVPVTFDGCRVISGEWVGLFTGTVVTNASDLDVDHMVPLANAHRSGGWAWDAATKRTYANDLIEPDHLIAVTSSANRSKGDKGPEEWRPPDESYWCEYASDWARIKESWSLTVTQYEFNALLEMLATCGFIASLQQLEDERFIPTPSPTVEGLSFDPLVPDRDCGDFTTWGDVNSFYIAAGGPESDPHRLDADGDGVPCESLK